MSVPTKSKKNVDAVYHSIVDAMDLLKLLLKRDELTYAYTVHNTSMDTTCPCVFLNRVTMLVLRQFQLISGKPFAALYLFMVRDCGLSEDYHATIVPPLKSTTAEAPVTSSSLLSQAFNTLNLPSHCAEEVAPVIDALFSYLDVPIGLALRVLPTPEDTPPEEIFLFGNNLFDNVFLRKTMAPPFKPRSIKQLLQARLPESLHDQFAPGTEAARFLALQIADENMRAAPKTATHFEDYNLPKHVTTSLRIGLSPTLLTRHNPPAAQAEKIPESFKASVRASVIANVVAAVVPEPVSSAGVGFDDAGFAPPRPSSPPIGEAAPMLLSVTRDEVKNKRGVLTGIRESLREQIARLQPQAEELAASCAKKLSLRQASSATRQQVVPAETTTTSALLAPSSSDTPRNLSPSNIFNVGRRASTPRTPRAWSEDGDS